MPMLQQRTIACDLCVERYTENEFGLGFPGWAIIQGIAPRKLKINEAPDSTNMTTCLCPKCKDEVAAVINHMQQSRGVQS